MTGSGVGRSGIAAVERAVHLLEVLGASREPQTMQSLATALQCSPSTVHRIVVTLHQADLLQFDPVGKRYALGAGITRLARQRAASADLAAVAQPFMERLRDEVEETVSLWVRSAGAKTCIAVAEGSHEIRQFVGVGTQATLELSAGSRVLMAGEEEPAVRAWARAALATAGTGRRDRHIEAAVVADVARTRTTGVVTVADADARTYARDVGTAASPVCGEGGDIVAALVVAGPAARFDGARMQEVAPALLTCARRITAAVAGTPTT